jgi:peptidoglycan hydrolase-like protein with peptidoglycan-binding domain
MTYVADDENTETCECCRGHHHEVPEGETESTHMKHASVDSVGILENESTFDDAEDLAWETGWHDEETRETRLVAGSATIQKVPLLRRHDGIGPDLLLTWNDLGSASSTIDVVVHFHGYSLSSGSRLHIVRDLKSRSGLDWSDPGNSASVGRTRPTLALLPRGHYYGGKSGRAYSFPALTAVGGVSKLVDFSLQHLAILLGVTAISRGRLILTAHSGGVASLLRIVRRVDPDEVHVFDGLYQDPGSLIAWATQRVNRDRDFIATRPGTPGSHMATHGGALRVLYGSGTARFSRSVTQALDRMLPQDSALRRWYRAERTTVSHLRTPPVYGWRLLADASADLPNAMVEQVKPRVVPSHELAIEGEDITRTGAVITFPTGISLPVITGPATAKDTDDLFDPVGSGNPLLDTSAVNKNLKLSPSFTVKELTTSKGDSADIARIDPRLVECLQRLRDHVGKSITIGSGFRSWKRNREIYKGREVTKSQHCAGRAADIRIAGMNGLQIAKAAIDACGPNIGIGVGGTFAHIDVRGWAEAWNYGGATAGWVADVKQYQKQKGGVRAPRRAPTKPPRSKLARSKPSRVATPAHDLVRFAQRVLNATERERLDTDGSLGPKTRAALDRFTTRYGIPARGDISEQIQLALAQRALEELAQRSLFVKGKRDAATEQAIARFRTQRVLGTDSTLDVATRSALADAVDQRTATAAPSPSDREADWTAVPQRNRMRYVMNRLIHTHLYPANGAAGLVGNLWAESALLPNRIEGSRAAKPMESRDNAGVVRRWTAQQVKDRVYQRTGPARGGVGLAQWTSANRRRGLFNHSYQGQIASPSILFNMDAQIDYLVQELRSDYSNVDRVLRRAGVTVNDACDEVLYNFEIPGSILFPAVQGGGKRPRSDPAVIAKFEERRAHARTALEAYSSQATVAHLV